MRLIGLTGGIGTGKSTVSAMLRELGAQVIDADAVAREVVEPGQPALREIARRFPGVVGSDGRLDRKALGERVFASPSERAALNAIIHPRIQAEVLRKTEALAEAGAELVIYDAPLLIENRLYEWMSGVILVSAPRQTQLARLMGRDSLTREQAEARLSAQLPLEEKAKHATWIVDNGGTLEQTRAQVERLWATIRGGG